MIRRLINAFSPYAGYPVSGIWSGFVASHHNEILQALTNRDEAALQAALNNPRILFGIEESTNFLWSCPQAQQMIARLAQRIGILPVRNPEQESPTRNWERDPNQLKHLVDREVGGIDLPDCFGLRYSGDACLHSHLYRISEWYTIRHFLGKTPTRILEIGAGIGSNVILAKRYGEGKYAVLDIPTTATISAFFVSKVLGEDNVILPGETRRGFASWFTPADMWAASNTYDLIINANSFPEIPQTDQDKYLALASKCLSPNGVLFSINHESDMSGQGSMNDAMLRNGSFKQIYRAPFMMRDGYMEEIYRKKWVTNFT